MSTRPVTQNPEQREVNDSSVTSPDPRSTTPSDVMPPRKAPEEYSTNPNTVKSRRRQQRLVGEKKIEEDGKTADYKAMIYARKNLTCKPEYQEASESQKKVMLESLMRETMEKRRQKGLDTISKLAAYRAGLVSNRDGVRGLQSRVPISAFLQDNGYVPSHSVQAAESQSHAEDEQKASIRLETHPTDLAANPSPAGNMDGPNRLPDLSRGNDRTRLASAPILSRKPIGANGSMPPRSRLSYNIFLKELIAPPLLPEPEVKAPKSPLSCASISPETEVIASVEQDEKDDVAALRSDVAGLRQMCRSLMEHKAQTHDHDITSVRAGMSFDSDRITRMDRRINQLEGSLHAMQNISMPAMADRVADMERVMESLNYKIGDGCEAEVAKMREVFASLREALTRVGNFL